MGGVDKPLQHLDGAPMVEHVVRRLAPGLAGTIISCNRNAHRYAQWGETVADDLPDMGPLGGVSAALSRVGTRFAMVVPGDAPLVDFNVVKGLRQAVGDAELAWPVDRERHQHLFLLLRVDLAEPLRRWLVDGGRSVGAWLAERDGVAVAMPDWHETFVNVNSPTALLRLQAAAADDGPEVSSGRSRRRS